MTGVRILTALLMLALGPREAVLAGQTRTCLAALAAAAAAEPTRAASRSLIYRGHVVDLGSGTTRAFTLTVQGGDRLLYVLRDPESREVSRWGVDGAHAWGHAAESGLLRLDDEGATSWRILALVLAPNRFTHLVRETVRCEYEGAADAAAPVVRVDLRGGGTLRLTLERNPFRLARLDRDARNGRRTTVFVGGRSIEGEPHLTALHTLRDGVPHALYRFDSVGYAPAQPSGFWAAPAAPVAAPPRAGS